MIRIRRVRSEHLAPIFLNEVENFRGAVRDRLLPAFNSLEQEAEKASAVELERLSAKASPDADEALITERAYFHGVDLYLTGQAMRRAALNLMTAGLYHLFEQQCQRVAAIEGFKKVEAKALPKKLLSKYGIDVSGDEVSGNLALLDELRLVANTVKHGSGDSCDELKTKNKSLFEEEYLKPLPKDIPLRPLTGDGLLLTLPDFESYAASVSNFWRLVDHSNQTQ